MTEYQRSELYFGLLRPNGEPIEPTSFDVFVQSYVVPVLPVGFTLLDGEGRYLVGDKDVREPSRVMVVLHRREPAVLDALERVRARYKETFAQESVLRADTSACASF